MLKQNKEILILSLIIILIIIVLVGVGWFFINKKSSSQPVKILSQPELQAQRLAEVKIYTLALANKDFKICKQIDSELTRNTCFENVAKDLQDIGICENINTQLDKNRCIYDIIIVRGAAAKSIEPCLELKEQSLIERCQNSLQGNNFCLGESCPQSASQ